MSDLPETFARFTPRDWEHVRRTAAETEPGNAEEVVTSVGYVCVERDLDGTARVTVLSEGPSGRGGLRYRSVTEDGWAEGDLALMPEIRG